jgi:hypothetical protein
LLNFKGIAVNSIQRIEQVLPPDLLKEVKSVIDTVPWKYGWASNKSIEYTHWNHSFAKAGALNTLDVSAELTGAIKLAWDHIQANIIGASALLRCYTNSHTYGVEGYPHTDSRRHVDKTLIVYMNPEWQRDWGGETTIYHGNQIAHAELPEYNHGLIFHGEDWHSARAVTRICPAQRITLMFKYAPLNTDPCRDNLQRFLTLVGAADIKHSGRSLWTHLLNVYDILKSHGYNQDVCLAGGLHSIFGTNVFKHATLTSQQRIMVVNTIGESATKIVELFSSIRRPNTLESALKTNTLEVELNSGATKTLTQIELNILCAIEAANLYDQKSLNKYPMIARFLRKPK